MKNFGSVPEKFGLKYRHILGCCAQFGSRKRESGQHHRRCDAESPKRFSVGEVIAMGGLKWQCIVNCHIFSFGIITPCSVK